MILLWSVLASSLLGLLLSLLDLEKQVITLCTDKNTVSLLVLQVFFANTNILT